MEFTQSRFQDVFSRSYELICHIGGYLLFGVALSFFISSRDVPTDLILGAILSAIATVCYFLFINRNGSKSITFGENTFTYRDHQTYTEFSWNDFQGYKISKALPQKLIIQDNIYGDTKISYYAFSSHQRKAIFDLLDKKAAEIDVN